MSGALSSNNMPARDAFLERPPARPKEVQDMIGEVRPPHGDMLMHGGDLKRA